MHKVFENLTKSYFCHSESNIIFIRGQKALPVFHAHRIIIRLPCGQGQLSRIWKVQCDWLSLGKECCLRLSRRLWRGMKDELPYKSLCGKLRISGCDLIYFDEIFKQKRSRKIQTRRLTVITR